MDEAAKEERRIRNKLKRAERRKKKGEKEDTTAPLSAKIGIGLVGVLVLGLVLWVSWKMAKKK